MADRPPSHGTQEKSGSNSKTSLYLIIGGLVLAAIIAFFIFGGNDADDVNVTTGGEDSTVEGAADDTGDAVEGAADPVDEPANTQAGSD